MNICGNVTYCFSSPPNGPYPNGIAIDIGFYWDGTDTGLLVSAGGDITGGNLVVEVTSAGAINAAGPSPAIGSITGSILPGRHLVSYYVSTSAAALYLDGVAVGTKSGSFGVPTLSTAYGPGFTVGSRLSNESPPGPNQWLKFAPFFFHLRNTATPTAWSLDTSTIKQTSTLAFLEASGVSGSSWTSTGGGLQAAAQDGLAWTSDYMVGCF
jgi:hypothetical protein